MLDYEVLRLIWWLLLGALLIGFAVMDGFDMGAASLLPFLARTDTERRHSTGPASVRPLMRGRSAVSASLASSRASGAPRQK